MGVVLGDWIAKGVGDGVAEGAGKDGKNFTFTMKIMTMIKIIMPIAIMIFFLMLLKRFIFEA